MRWCCSWLSSSSLTFNRGSAKPWRAEITIIAAKEMPEFLSVCTRPFLNFMFILCPLGVLCGTEDKGKQKRIKMDLLIWLF